VFDAVLKNIVASLTADNRDCYIVYGSSLHNAIGWAKPAILASRLFVEVPATPMPLFLDAVRTMNYAVFRADFLEPHAFTSASSCTPRCTRPKPWHKCRGG
jgi:hypothetical protein